MDDAKGIILTPDSVRSTKQRWETETPYLMGLIREHMPRLTRGARCLDYGCGIGRLAKPMTQDGWHVMGVDISPAMIGFSLQYVASDNFLPCLPGIFDQLLGFGIQVEAAVSVWALQHVAKPREDIARIKAALVPGGKLFVMNASRRFVPTTVGWVDDGFDIWGELCTQLSSIDFQQADLAFVSGTPTAYWGFFEKTA
jgi:2-polyprenyl-3-methyl-5-hydroxy-6-metoxy-1,4-benzoquinol methylase